MFAALLQQSFGPNSLEAEIPSLNAEIQKPIADTDNTGELS